MITEVDKMYEKYAVLNGAEEFYIQGGDIGILLSHGFIGTPQSVRYLGEKLATYKYTVFAPRLKGHGTHYNDLEKCHYEDWYHSIKTGYELLKTRCETIFVIGQSMGGTLALHLVHEFELSGAILINPALTIPSYEHLKGMSAPRFIEEGKPDIKAKDVTEIAYEKVPLTAIHQLQTLMEQTPTILSEIHTPILGIQSAVDHVVPPENTDFILQQVKSETKEKVILPNSYHVASMDNDKDIIVETAHQFIFEQI